jgi:putative ATP-dependent endonuclease of OLD family
MFIKSIRIRNYRSFKDSGDIPLTQSATFLGPNGAGKSNVLKAIRAFYDVNAVVTIEDFFNRDSSEPISISIVFHNLNSDEVNFFGKFVQDNILSVEKKFSYSEGASKGLYYGQFRQHGAFSGIRALSGREKINAYNKFRQEHSREPLYQALPTARSSAEVDQALSDWEGSHQDQLQWVQAPVQFFGARNIGGGSLDNFTRFVFVPAVREATLDASDSKGGALGELLSILVKEVIFQREDLLEFRRRTVEEFRRLTAPERLPEIPTLEQKLTTRLRAFVPQSSVHLSLGEIKEPAINFPETKVELTEDNFRGQIEGKGHGLQRSFIISIIQELGIVQAQKTRDTAARSSQCGSSRKYNCCGL